MDSKQLFSTKVDNYVKYRPSYPPEVISTLRDRCGLSPSSLIADIGSGTGNLAKLFLLNGNQVIGVEPNFEMCSAGKALLRGYSGFRSVMAAAEATALADHCMDFVVAGQAFHWFDGQQTLGEFSRVLKSGGWTALVWNVRLGSRSALSRDYEELCVRYGINYNSERQREPNEREIGSFFGKDGYVYDAFENQQVFDYDGLKGRLLSSSYIPGEGHPDYLPMLRNLERIFQNHQSAGVVRFGYETQMFYGHLSGH